MLNGKPTLWELFETNEDLEQHGIDLKIGPATFKVCRAGGSNKRFQTVMQRLLRPYSRSAPSEDVAESILMRGYAESVVIGWEGVTDREGHPLPYDVDNFIMVMKGMPEIWKIIMVESDKLSNFRKAELEEAGKNMGER